MDKRDIRKQMVELRCNQKKELIENLSKIIQSKLYELPHYKNAQNIMFYIDAKNEVKTDEAILKSISLGKSVYVPKIIGKGEMIAVKIKSLDELQEGHFGILEPISDEAIEPQNLDIVIVPGVAFDRRGYRIGYGGGYYDRFLKKLSIKTVKIAFAFEFQILDTLPQEEHDILMDIIISEKQIYFMK